MSCHKRPEIWMEHCTARSKAAGGGGKNLEAGTRLKTGNRILILCKDCREKKKKKKDVWAAHLASYWPLPGRDNNRFSVNILWPTYCTRRLSYYDLILIARLQATPSQDIDTKNFIPCAPHFELKVHENTFEPKQPELWMLNSAFYALCVKWYLYVIFLAHFQLRHWKIIQMSSLYKN